MIHDMAGLFTMSPGARPWEEDELKPIPLLLVNIDAKVDNFVAEVLMTQKYKNKEKNPLEVVYRFPIEEDAAVTACSAVLDGKTIVARIQENKKAEKMYNEAINENKTAVLLSSARPDIFEMKIGNLAPGSECSVTIKYVMELPVEDRKTRLTIPTTIAPKYVADRHSSSVVPKVLKNILYKEETPAPLTFNLKVVMKTKIVEVTSPSHALVTEMTRNADKFEATAKFDGTNSDMDRDLVVLIESTEPNDPKVILEKGSDGSLVAMLTFVPSFELRKQAAECIFLIDCSGSMGGDSIRIAREALGVFIHSLPVDAHFNVICFGSSYRKLFQESKALTDESLAEAKSLIQRIDANLGGTEIYTPLNYIFKLPKIVGKPRQVFVITDGEVSNSMECVNLVSRNATNNRVFTLGIGSAADRHLVKGMARSGMGTHAFTDYNENISGKVMKQLKDALQPCIYDVELDWGADQSALEFCQAPMKIPPLYDGTRMLVFRLWEENAKLADKVKISAVTPEGTLSEEIKIASSDYKKGEMIHRMFARKMIQDLEEQHGMDDDSSEINTVITDLGLKYSLASKMTSFIGVSETKNEGEGEIVSRQVHNQVPDRMFGGVRSMNSSGFGAMRAAMSRRGPAPGAAPPTFSVMSMSSYSSMPPPGCPAPGAAAPGCPAPGAAPGAAYYDSDDDMEVCDSMDTRSFRSVSMTDSIKIVDLSRKSDMEKILHIASSQSAAGMFKMDKAIEKLIGENKVEKFKKASEGKSIAVEKWWTALVIAFVQNSFKKEKDTWELFIQKATDWLNNATLIVEAKQSISI